jgi:hypothetical protein
MTKTLLSLGAFASLVLPAATAFAADKAACIDAAEKGQTLRRGHQLIEARDQFRICAGQDCPAVVQKDCAGWLESIGSRIPSVVVTANDGDGAPLIEVRVSVDGTVVRTRLDGLTFSLNPGEHAFHFELADGTALDRQVLVTEGQKSETVDVVLGKPSAKPAAAPPEGTAAPLAETPPGASRSSGGSTAGWIVGGVGVVGHPPAEEPREGSRKDCASWGGTCVAADADGGADGGCSYDTTACASPGATCAQNAVLSCDGTGRQTKYDCSAMGLQCSTDGVGYHCLAPGCEASDEASCAESCEADGITLDLCIGGAPMAIDCTSYGFARCAKSANSFFECLM